MFGQLNGSSYYRANPYYQQGYLPDTAFKNRKLPSYMVEIPQGEKYFDPTNKKHFQRLGYFSTIGNEHIMDPDPIGSPSRDKNYFRNLNVDDIEGSSTNTLISKAVKNKLKAKQYLAEREREQKELQQQQRMMNLQRGEDQRKRLEALSKINRANEPNYHEKIMKMRTQQSEKQSPQPTHPKENPPSDTKPSPPSSHAQQKNHYQIELQKTEREIRELQAELRANRHQLPSNPTYNYQQRSPYRGKQVSYEHEKYQQMRNSLPQPYKSEERQPESYRRQPPSLNPPFNFTQRQNSKLRKEVEPTAIPQLQNNQLGNYRNYSGGIDPSNKIRSLTDHRQANGYEPPYERRETKEGEFQRNIQTPIYDHRNQLKPTREEHRRINPTYLSYGSPSIGLAGRNIIGY